VQANILERYPDADLRVLVGWIPVLPGDANPQVADLLVDRRASHFWDGGQKVGFAVSRLLGRGDDYAAWDIFLVYGPDAKWGDKPAAVGSPVVSQSGALERALRPYL
jgi:hypothetical protein